VSRCGSTVRTVAAQFRSPIIAGYPLVTLLLSRAFLEKENVGPQLIAGVTGAVCGVVLLLVA
jgi:drug/metabolite transporter (DMT)-like permease